MTERFEELLRAKIRLCYERPPLKPNSKAKQKKGRRGVPTPPPRPQQRVTWVKKSHTKRNVGILLFLFLIIGIGVYSIAQSTPGSTARPIQIANSAWKTATLTNAVTGQDFTLSQFSGKVIVLQFMATYCQFCLAEGHQLTSVQQSLSGNSQAAGQVVIVSVDVDPNENLAQLKQYVQQNNFGAPSSNPAWVYAKDKTGQLLQSIAGSVDFGYFIAQTPMYFVDKQQSNSFLSMQRSLTQEANPASDIITLVNKMF
jgi:thiol-disulfide isomerase/thioredoxin